MQMQEGSHIAGKRKEGHGNSFPLLFAFNSPVMRGVAARELRQELETAIEEQAFYIYQNLKL
jgi:hypothetical protein